MTRAKAVGTSIAAADNDHMLPRRQDFFACRDGIAFIPPVLLRKKFHRKVDPFQLASRDIEISRLFRTTGEKNRVELLSQIFGGYFFPYMGICLECHPLTPHLLKTPVDKVLFHLEIWNAVAEQSADAIILLEYRNRMACTRKLLRGGESCGAGSYHRHPFA